jgi:dGTPase
VDEIAYNTADLDDGYEAHLLDLGTIRGGVPIFAEAFAAAEKRAPAGRAKLLFNEALRSVLDHLASDLITTTREQIRAAGVRDVEGVRRAGKRLAQFSPDAARQNGELKRFLFTALYDNAAIVEDRERSVDALEELFRYYVARSGAMPPYYAEQALREPVHRVVCDYIAGMTDHFLLKQHRELVGGGAARSGE